MSTPICRAKDPTKCPVHKDLFVQTVYGYIYEIENLLNGKTYIGQRKLSNDTHWFSYMGSGQAVKAAIEKYGIDNFEKRLIAISENPDELTKIEDGLIVQAWLQGKAQYNLGRTPPPDTQRRLPAEKIAEKSRKLKENMAKLMADPNYKSGFKIQAERTRAAYDEFCNQYGEQILKLYNEFQSAQAVADSIGSGGHKWIIRFLKEQNVNLNYRNLEGSKQSEETKQKIRDKAREQIPWNKSDASSELQQGKRYDENGNRLNIFICQSKWCGKEFESAKARQQYCSDKCEHDVRSIEYILNITGEYLHKLQQEGKSIREIIEIIGGGSTASIPRAIQRYKDSLQK